jgi:alpha/beta superfamily hydrolase
MANMFTLSKFNGNISKWNVSNVEDMGRMFQDSQFTGDISNWNVGRVKNMYAMFMGSRFNGDISKWNVSNVENMAEMKPISYKTRDGLTVNGYLTLPNGMLSKNLPVIVIPHGGPDSRNSWGYNSEVQFLASRGYAVFQVNFRGSKGYGKNFWIAGFKEWGAKMQNDITDGVQWLIAQKIADPSRIGIYGFSFGGFSALHGLISNPELYKCGASYSGFTNLFTYFKDIPGSPSNCTQYNRKNLPVKELSFMMHPPSTKIPSQGSRMSCSTSTTSPASAIVRWPRRLPCITVM